MAHLWDIGLGVIVYGRVDQPVVWSAIGIKAAAVRATHREQGRKRQAGVVPQATYGATTPLATCDDGTELPCRSVSTALAAASEQFMADLDTCPPAGEVDEQNTHIAAGRVQALIDLHRCLRTVPASGT